MGTQYIGATINLTSKSGIRYRGQLASIDPEQANISLENVYSMGTEGRRGNPAEELPPSSNLYEFITFKASDIGDLKIDDGNSKPEPPPAPPVPDDPAILSAKQPSPAMSAPQPPNQGMYGASPSPFMGPGGYPPMYPGGYGYPQFPMAPGFPGGPPPPQMGGPPAPNMTSPMPAPQQPAPQRPASQAQSAAKSPQAAAAPPPPVASQQHLQQPQQQQQQQQALSPASAEAAKPNNGTWAAMAAGQAKQAAAATSHQATVTASQVEQLAADMGQASLAPGAHQQQQQQQQRQRRPSQQQQHAANGHRSASNYNRRPAGAPSAQAVSSMPEFDFQSSTAAFEKEKEAAAAESAADGPVYSKTSSFFDNLSSDAKERQEGPPAAPSAVQSSMRSVSLSNNSSLPQAGGHKFDRAAENQKNMNTFGETGGFRGGRGRGRGGRGRGGRRGRGGNRPSNRDQQTFNL